MKTSRVLGALCVLVTSIGLTVPASAATVWKASYSDYVGNFTVSGVTAAYCGIFPIVAPCADIVFFERPNDVDWTNPVYQDLIIPDSTPGAGDGVSLTRGELRGLFNILQETEYEKPNTLSPSPRGTLWAIGSVDDLYTGGTITPSTVFADDFREWGDMVFFNGPIFNLKDVNAMIYLIDYDIYLDYRLLSWQTGGGPEPNCSDTPNVEDPSGVNCGGFSHIRANGTNSYMATVLNNPNPVPVPAAVWLFGSGLLGLVGVARRRQA